ncbi:MAG: hypothetical protein JST82_03685 [Bacteroidetes bacterium]|nr:hypothetical protein [Bacteroidota bacterium]
MRKLVFITLITTALTASCNKPTNTVGSQQANSAQSFVNDTITTNYYGCLTYESSGAFGTKKIDNTKEISVTTYRNSNIVSVKYDNQKFGRYLDTFKNYRDTLYASAFFSNDSFYAKWYKGYCRGNEKFSFRGQAIQR